MNHAKESIELEEPPDIRTMPKNINNFIFGDKKYIMEIVKDGKEANGGAKLEDDDAEEIVYETL